VELLAERQSILPSSCRRARCVHRTQVTPFSPIPTEGPHMSTPTQLGRRCLYHCVHVLAKIRAQQDHCRFFRVPPVIAPRNFNQLHIRRWPHRYILPRAASNQAVKINIEDTLGVLERRVCHNMLFLHSSGGLLAEFWHAAKSSSSVGSPLLPTTDFYVSLQLHLSLLPLSIHVHAVHHAGSRCKGNRCSWGGDDM
jgi:hypothetical protein